MKKTLAIFAILMTVALTACQNNVFDDMPQKIQDFVSQYYPDSKISNYFYNGKTYTVDVTGGPTLIFDSQQSWTSINGNGMPVPDMLLYDQIPTPLYEYLQQTSALGKVFAVQRDDKQYTLQLLSIKLTYDIATAKITTETTTTD